MSLLNMNSAASVLEAIIAARDEMDGFDRGIWPHESMVPIESRASYQRTIEASWLHLCQRLTTLQTQAREWGRTADASIFWAQALNVNILRVK